MRADVGVQQKAVSLTATGGLTHVDPEQQAQAGQFGAAVLAQKGSGQLDFLTTLDKSGHALRNSIPEGLTPPRPL